MSNLQFKKVVAEAKFPTKGTDGSAGWDLYALEGARWRPTDGKFPFIGKNIAAVPVRTGIAVKLPPDTYGRLALRSGVSFLNGLDLVGGVIDGDYRGELVVGIVAKPQFVAAADLNKPEWRNVPASDLIELGKPNTYYLVNSEYVIPKGERFAQLLIEKIDTSKPVMLEANEPFGDEPQNDHKGWGSTGS